MSRLPDARRWRLEGSWWRRDPLDDLTPGWGVGKESLCLGARPSPRGAHAGGRFGGGVVRGTPSSGLFRSLLPIQNPSEQ